jgi:hypothetical protein
MRVEPAQLIRRDTTDGQTHDRRYGVEHEKRHRTLKNGAAPPVSLADDAARGGAMKRLVWVMVLFGGLLAGCGPPRNAPVVRPAQITDPAQLEGPLWIAFEEGDELPVFLDVSGPTFELEAPTLVLKIRRRVYLLIGDGKPRLSFDRETFLDGGGSFALGIGNSKERGPHVNVIIRHHGGASP